jgi:outer membrane scaffolding protein for murein synthesis (MipA/OmpV family)
MMISKSIRMAAFAAVLFAATPAAAQDSSTSLPDPNDRSDNFTLGVGAAYLPDYEGSNDYRFIPAAAIRGQVGGLAFFSRATYLYLDLVPRAPGKVEFDFGPIVGVRLNRTGKVDDVLVNRLPDRKAAFEVGGFGGFTVHGLTNPYDALSARVDLVKDVGNAHGAMVLTPSLDFGTPLSETFYIGTSLSADFVAEGYADYYFSVTPAEALVSGLPAYNANGGFKNWKVGLLANQSLSGDLRHGLSLFATGNYAKLTGSIADSPLVRQRGRAGQFFVATGLGYSW